MIRSMSSRSRTSWRSSAPASWSSCARYSVIRRTARRIASSARCCCSASRSSRVRSETAPPSATSWMRADRRAHGPLVDHPARDRRDLLEVVGGAAGDRSRRPAAPPRGRRAGRRARPSAPRACRGSGPPPGSAGRSRARVPRGTIETRCVRVEPGSSSAQQRVPGLVEGDDAALVLVERAARLHAGHDALERVLEVGLLDARAAARARRRSRPRCRCWPARRRSARTVWRAMISKSTSLASGLLRVCTPRIALRPTTSGGETKIWRSKRPGRSSAGSSLSSRFDAAITTRSPLVAKPSISTSSWLSVCSRSELLSEPRRAPTASISSMKTIAGAFLRASANRRRMRAAPRPANISTKLAADCA